MLARGVSAAAALAGVFCDSLPGQQAQGHSCSTCLVFRVGRHVLSPFVVGGVVSLNGLVEPQNRSSLSLSQGGNPLFPASEQMVNLATWAGRE